MLYWKGRFGKYTKPLPQIDLVDNHSRRMRILKRISDSSYGCLVNRKWCFAVTWEPAVKWLLKKQYVRLRRMCAGRSGSTYLVMTDKGKKYYASLV